MIDIVNCASGSVDGDILKTIAAEDEGTEEYKSIYDALAVYRDNVELGYVYGIKVEGDGTFTFTVDPAIDAPAPFGKAVIRTEDIALILLDLVMPEMDGFILYKMIREKYNLPVVLMTADRSVETLQKISELHMDDYLEFYFVICLQSRPLSRII
ncbi:MAG: response regulator [Lachnospiraceae bacterium]|nr:response regulator [Lachnospiraceae bacterium]